MVHRIVNVAASRAPMRVVRHETNAVDIMHHCLDGFNLHLMQHYYYYYYYYYCCFPGSHVKIDMGSTSAKIHVARPFC